MQSYLMCLDAGTGSVRAVIFDALGKQVGLGQREWTHKEDPRWPNSMDFDWDYNWELTKLCIREALESAHIDAAEISAITTTCMREGIVLYDRDMHEIWACANVDARSTDEVAALIESNPALEKELYLESGQTYALGALPRLMWVKNKMPEIYERTSHLGMFNDWLTFKLTGRLVAEPSNGSTTGIMNLTTRTWDPSIASRVGIRSDIFGEVQESGTILGSVSEAAARETGLATGTTVVVGGGDCQLGMLGVHATRPDDAAVFGGSFWQLEYNSDTPTTDDSCRIRVNCAATPGLWQLEALAFKPGLVMRWFRDAFCHAEKAEAKERAISAYEVLNEHAQKVPAGSLGMLCCFSDVMNYIHWLHASPTFTNFELDERFDKYVFYRSILENTALLVRGHIELIDELCHRRPKRLIFAGGAAKSDLWAQIVSDVCEIEVAVPKEKEATALGGAILAASAVGIYASIDEAADKMVHIEKTFSPNKELAPVYRALYKSWRDVYSEQLKLAESHKTKSMWKAPGL